MTSVNVLERRQALEVAAFALPATLLMAFVFIVPLTNVVIQSFSAEETGAFTIGAYRRILSGTLFLRVGAKTLQITVLATGFALLLAYPLAYFLAQQPPRKRALLSVLVLVPFWTSVLVKSFAFTVVLARLIHRRSGIRWRM